MNKRLMIVIEDMGDGTIRLDLQGDTERLHDGTSEEELTLAEYWGSILAQACARTLQTGSEFEAFKNMQVDSEIQ